MAIRVREFEPSDQEAVRRIFIEEKVTTKSGYSSETSILNRMFAEEKTSPTGDMSRIDEFYFRSGQPARCFWVAVDDAKGGEIVGFIGSLECTYQPVARSSFHDVSIVIEPSRCLELVRFTVSSQHQRRGIGQLLLQMLENFAVRHSFTAIYLTTLLGMHSAVGFYRKCGFTNFLVELESIPLPDGQPFDAEIAHFIRRIAPSSTA